MGRQVRCPLCGRMTSVKSLVKWYDLQAFEVTSLGKAHGFRFVPVLDESILSIVKEKILNLYRFFWRRLPSPAVSMRPRASASLSGNLSAGMAVPVSIVIRPEVKS